MVQFILETDNLIFELDDFTFAVHKLGFFVLQVEGLGVYQFIEIVNPGKLLGDIVLEGSGLCGKICTFLAFEFVLIIEFVNFLSILSVSLS